MSAGAADAEDEGKVLPTRPGMFISEADQEDGILPEGSDPELDAFLKAAEEGNIDLLTSLLRQRPQLIHSGDSEGYRAVHRAAYSDQPEALQFLLGAGGSVESRTDEGWTPAHSAARWNAHRALKVLLTGGADVNAMSHGGQTPLHLAAEFGEARESLTLLLLHPDIRPNVRNNGNDLPLDIALRTGNYAYLFDLGRESVNRL